MSTKKSKIKNGFGRESKIKVKWCHSNRQECDSIPEDEFDDAPMIGGNAGYLILQAFYWTGAGQFKSKESSITLDPSSLNDHKVILSYNPNTHEWKVEAEEIVNKGGPKEEKQINVNVEIGPKISKFE